jgi:hypothetical protein
MLNKLETKRNETRTIYIYLGILAVMWTIIILSMGGII